MDKQKGFLEQNLAESQGKDVCRILFDGSPDAIFLADTETGVIIDANPAAERLTGRQRRELIGLHQSQLHPPDREARSKSIFRDHTRSESGIIRSGPELHYVLRADGSEVPIEITAQVINIRGKRVLQGFFRDVSERVKAERALVESEIKFKTLTEKSMVGVYLIQDGGFRYVNPTLASLLGYTQEELLALSPQDVIVPEDWPLVKENLRRRLEGEVSSLSYAFRGRKKNGEVLHVEVFGTRIDYLGRPAVLGTLLDLTELRRDQEALRESEELYRTLVDNAPVGITVYRGGKLLFANRQMLSIGGLKDQSSILGRDVLDFVHPDSRQQAAARLLELARTGKPLPPAEIKIQAPGGTVFNMEVLSIPIPYKGKDCIMSIFEDVTARKRAESELRRAHNLLLEANSGLEKRVEERTAQLADLNKELEAFSYSAAHDMKAPLRRINIFADLLEKEAAPELREEHRATIRMIHKSVLHMTSLVEGLLTLSTAGRRPLDKDAVVLSEILGEVLADIKSENPDRVIEWHTESLPQVKCDRAMIKQVFVNLLSNAVKYTSSRPKARIEISCRLEGGFQVVRVRDNGVGFPPQYKEKVFDVFQRLHKSEDFSGTGIGLSIAKRIIARHGGRIWAESEPDKGATFWFSLPAE
ncbi:MAG: PAS domain S-box protein [Elusimicrobia bacterium]|nr:PAS domain S-box protein [Elusimicrobiota bacterium]